MNKLQPHIDPDTKTLETSAIGKGCFGIIIEGEHKGTAFIKNIKDVKIIQFDSLPYDFKKYYIDNYSHE